MRGALWSVSVSRDTAVGLWSFTLQRTWWSNGLGAVWLSVDCVVLIILLHAVDCKVRPCLMYL